MEKNSGKNLVHFQPPQVKVNSNDFFGNQKLPDPTEIEQLKSKILNEWSNPKIDHHG